jgi:hypothetical protein
MKMTATSCAMRGPVSECELVWCVHVGGIQAGAGVRSPEKKETGVG